MPTADDMMKAYAEDAVDYTAKVFGITLDYSSDSVARVEDVAVELHNTMPRRIFRALGFGPSKKELDVLSKMLGGYVGEVIRRQKGGTWKINDELQAIGLQLNADTWIFPPAKVHKRIVNGPEDNILSFYNVAVENLDAIAKASKQP